MMTTTQILTEIKQRESFLDVFSSEYREEPNKFDVDPLVLSVRLKKMKALDTVMFRRLEDPEVKAELAKEDFDDAETIKNYYGKKLMWTALKDSRLSEYRKVLQHLLEHPKTTLSKKETGLIVTLPYFYEEDLVLDTLTKNYLTENTPDVRPNLKKFTRELTFVDQTSRWLNKKRFIYYWFVDDNKYVYNIQIDEGNVLRTFFEDIVLAKPTSIFESHLTKVQHPFDYYKLFDYKIVKEKNA